MKQKLVDLRCKIRVISQKGFLHFVHVLLHLLLLLLLEEAYLNNHKINELESLHVERYHYLLGNRDIILLTLVVLVLLIVISPSNVSATMVTINLKVSMCIIANSNITKSYVINPCDSCNTDVNTPLNAIHVHVYCSLTLRTLHTRTLCLYVYVRIR